MDPYAAQTQTQSYPPSSSSSSSSQLQPQIQDPYLYHQQQYDPSHQQHYAYYAQISQPQYDQSQQYPNPQQQVPQTEDENAPIHPPGVPVQNEPNQTATAYQQAYAQPVYQTDPPYYYYQQYQQQLSYPDPGTGQQVQQQQGQPGDYGPPPPNMQGGPYGGSGRGGPGRGGSRGGGSGRGGGRGGGFGRGGGRGFRGGGGRGGITRVKSEQKPQVLAWCELCRVDCNTNEVLENHKNGKKHKKNMEIQEELQRLAGKTQEIQIAPDIERVEVKLESQTMQCEGNGLKRKMRDEERKHAERGKKPREVVPFICELCDVKCESAPAFDNHLKGRRHRFNVERFQEQQVHATLNHVAFQALYPAFEAALYPVLLQALAHNASTSYGYRGGLDQHALLQLLQPFLPQIGPAFFPHGLAPPPGPPALGPPQGPTPEAVDNQVDPVNDPESNTEDDVKPENKTEEAKPENKTEDKVEPEIKTEDEVKPEIKTEEVDPNAVEPTQ